MGGPTFLFILLSLVSFSANSHLQSSEEGYVSVVISETGLAFAKDLLIEKAVSSIIPLQLPDIERSVRIPLVGRVHIVLSSINIDHLDITSSFVETNDSGISLIASGATAYLTMNWKYSYSSWAIKISDHGDASVQVEGMDIGLSVSLKEQNGTLKLSLLECWCNIEDISIDLDGGGASWLYQVVVDLFEKKIGSLVKNAISKKTVVGIEKLDSLLQSLPKSIRVGSTAALNVTFVSNPVFHNSSAGFKINGLFTQRDEGIIVSSYSHLESQDSINCDELDKMIEISLHENVLNSASQVLFHADHMQWIVNKFPNQTHLNTAAWRDIFPQLYDQYPDDAINLNISVSSTPIIRVTNPQIDVAINLDVIIDVIDSGQITPIACVSLEITATGFPEIVGNSLTGQLSMKSLILFLRWSTMGSINPNLVQAVTSAIIETVLLPYVNSRLERGFHLPLVHGFGLQNAEIFRTHSRIIICSDVKKQRRGLVRLYALYCELAGFR